MPATCEAKKSNGKRCRKPAGWGTPHPGSGHCRLHDNVPRTISKGLPNAKTVRQLAEEFRRDKDPFDLREEIAITRSAVAGILDEVENDGNLPVHAKALNMLLNTCGKLIQRLHEIEVGRRYVVSIDQVQRSLKQITLIVCDAIPDPETRAQVAQRIEALALEAGASPAPETDLSASEARVIGLLSEQSSES